MKEVFSKAEAFLQEGLWPLLPICAVRMKGLLATQEKKYSPGQSWGCNQLLLSWSSSRCVDIFQNPLGVTGNSAIKLQASRTLAELSISRVLWQQCLDHKLPPKFFISCLFRRENGKGHNRMGCLLFFFSKYHRARLNCVHRLSKNTEFVPGVEWQKKVTKPTEIKCKSFFLFVNVYSFSFLNQLLLRTY